MKENMRTWTKGELGVLFLLAAAVGAAIKVEATKRITMGYDDWKAENVQQAYNFVSMEKSLVERQAKGKTASDGIAVGNSCAQ